MFLNNIKQLLFGRIGRITSVCNNSLFRTVWKRRVFALLPIYDSITEYQHCDHKQNNNSSHGFYMLVLQLYYYIVPI